MTLRRTFSILLLFVFIVGCSGGGDQLKKADVSGVVTLDGQPLEGAEINFFSEEGDFLASGMTDAEGKYQLYQGAAVGMNKVWISKDSSKSDASPGGEDPAENPDADVSQLEAAGSVSPKDEVEGEELPPKFSNPEKTKLAYTVPSRGATDADFKLTKE